MNPGEAATLAVAVNADDTTGLQIKWSGYYSGSGYKDINVTASGTNATTEPLTKACTIYCNVLDRYGNQESCYFNVGIENHLRVSKGDTGAYFADGYAEYVERGQSVPVPLAVSVSADKLQDLKYQWSRYWTDDNGTYRSEMLGTQPKQESGVIDHAWHYSCSVTDCYGNSESTSFTVGIINHLTLVAEETGLDYGTVVTVPLNGSTTLKVVCSADDMTNLRYDWHRYRYDANGKYQSNSNLGNGTTLNTGALDCSWTYTCTARDLHGNTESCSFDVNIENGFRAVTESGDISTSLDLPLNGTKGLTVTATANDMTGMKYQWSKTPYSTLMRYDSSTQIGGATSATLLCDPAEKAMVYRCTVTDRFGTEIECSYYVWVENHLNLRPVTGTASEDDWIVKMNVEKGARATLQVSASADDTAGLRYEWYEGRELTGARYSRNTVLLADGPSFTTPPIVERKLYFVYAIDKYGNMESLLFRVAPNTGNIDIAKDKVLYLPKNLRTVQAEAFANVTAQAVVIPASVTTIEDGAFQNLIIIGDANSAAERYAKANGLVFMLRSDFNG